MKNTKKLLYSLYAAATVVGAATLSGCATRTVYVYPAGYPTTPTPTYVTPSSGCAPEIFTGILMGIGQGLSGL